VKCTSKRWFRYRLNWIKSTYLTAKDNRSCVKCAGSDSCFII